MKKLFITLAILFSSVFCVFALPGFSPIVRDIPGEYVYYRDFTFEHESYVGFLTYDEKTYSARYYAPAQEKSRMPSKDIMIFFTINPESEHMELTGEKVMNIQLLTEEDMQIVNYLHDLIYEFNSRRIKLVENNVLSRTQDELEYSGKIASDEDFAQFGGSVQIEWNTLIPLFNLESIYSESDAKKMMYVATIGRITSSDDKSFENFKGFSADFKEKKHKAKINKKAENFAVELKNCSFTLTSDWQRNAENMFSLGGFAVFFETPVEEENLNFIKRQFLLSSGQNYIDFANLEFKNNTFKANYYNFETGNVTTTFKKFLKTKSKNSFEYCSLSVFSDVYRKNKNYFEKIADSFKIN